MRNQNNEKIETNNWTRLLIIDDNIFCRNNKKIILKTYPPKSTILSADFALKLRIYRSLKKVVYVSYES